MSATDAQLQALVAAQLRTLADALSAQPPSTADAPSLCAGWTVRHVVAHMSMAARYGTAEFMAELAAAGHDFTTLSNTIAERDGALPFDRLLTDLRSDTMAAWAPPGGGAAGALSHAVIHGLDITAALGQPRAADDTAVRLVLDSLTAGGVWAQFGVDPAGWCLRATDLDWEFGDGPVLPAKAGDLILALASRARPGLEPLKRTR